jgi:hypothetical protein
MAQTTPAAAAPSAVPAADADALHLVLFGLPGAGKTSLLGALGEAAQTQEHLLGGKLIDHSQGLAALSRQLYEESPRRTAEEVTPFPVRYEPFSPDGKAPAPGPTDAVLVDCDGRVANDLLVRRQVLDEDSPEGTLANEVVDAEAVILVVDSSAPEAEIETDFAELNRFLKLMERGRGQRAEVGGLPVYLVLTKCDLLAKPGDGAAAWMERIEQRKREVDAHFRDFLARDEEDGKLARRASEGKEARSASEAVKPEAPARSSQARSASEGITQSRSASEGMEETSLENAHSDLDLSSDTSVFGRIDLHVWATAVKRPALLGQPARPREPYGVGELFRQCFTEAQRYRTAHLRSTRRLLGTVIASGLLVAGMLALAVTLFLVNRNTQAAALAARVEDFRFFDQGPPAKRFDASPSQLKEKQRRLQDIHDDPAFSALRPESRAFVEGRLEELTAYIAYLEKVVEERPPAAERTEEGLDRRIERLKKELAVPRDEWAGTPAALLVRQRLDAGEALRRALQAVRNWYLDSIDAAGKLWSFADYRPPNDVDWESWTEQAEKLIDPGRKLPFNPADPIPGAPGSMLTYAVAMQFDRVLDARASWDSERARLRHLLEICSALALATASKERPAVLVFPRGFSLAACRTRVAELKLRYPHSQTAFVRDSVSEAILPRVQQAARNHYKALLEPARAEVLRQLQLAGRGKEETPARWQTVRTWLREPEELASWRVLAGVLLRLDDPTAEDPVTALASFLGRTTFPVEVRTLTLTVPDLRGVRPRPESRLVVLHPASDRQPALAFEPSGEPRRDAKLRAQVYTYRLSEGQRIVFRPGDKLWAELPLSGGKERLVWSEARSQMYQVERLRNPPRRQPSDAASLSEGRVLEDVRLAIAPDDGVPRVPDLMPVVRLTE